MVEKKLKENEIIVGTKTYIILPIKIKHLKNNFYSNYMTVKKMGLVKLLNFNDGEQFIIDLLEAILDSEELAKEVLENIDAQILKTIMEITKKINEIDDEPDEKNA